MGHPVVANVVVNIFDVFPLLRQSPMGMYENLEIIRDKGDCVQRKSQKSVLERCMKMYQKKRFNKIKMGPRIQFWRKEADNINY